MKEKLRADNLTVRKTSGKYWECDLLYSHGAASAMKHVLTIRGKGSPLGPISSTNAKGSRAGSM
jgi:hypothetical protein